jgi:hypothetical protein
MQQLDFVRECGQTHLKSPRHLQQFLAGLISDGLVKKKLFHLVSGFCLNASAHGLYFRLLIDFLHRYEVIQSHHSFTVSTSKVNDYRVPMLFTHNSRITAPESFNNFIDEVPVSDAQLANRIDQLDGNKNVHLSPEHAKLLIYICNKCEYEIPPEYMKKV